jgi:hypothetical protein
MLKKEKPAIHIEGALDGEPVQTRTDGSPTNRRAFLNKLGGAAVLAVGANAIEMGPLAKPASAREGIGGRGGRAQEAFKIRVRAAAEERDVRIPSQVTNGDEERYPNFIGNFSKGLPHNSIGEVDESAYERLIDAAEREKPDGFEIVPLGGTAKLVNPAAGAAFDLEGTDSHQLAIGPPPALASQIRADDILSTL